MRGSLLLNDWRPDAPGSLWEGGTLPDNGPVRGGHFAPQHFLNLRPLPQAQGSLRPGRIDRIA